MRGKVYFSTAFGKDGYFVDGFDSDEVLAVDSDKLFGFEYLFETVQTEVEGILIVGLYYNEGDPPDREKELVISCTFMHFRLSPTVTRSLHAGWGRSKSRKKKASII
ncbi:MAG: hypothetical protein H6Q14_1660 [Bacteroidetes bacterium]|nr:hypothetical protein [Bacteroidota bacterium]